MNGQWQPYTLRWVNADALSSELKPLRTFTSFNAMAASIKNVIFGKFRTAKKYSHAGFIVGKSGTNLEIAQHTRNYVAWTNGAASGWKDATRWMLGTWK